MNIGITGSIACGKSTVSNYLRSKGYTIIDADKIGHDALEDDKIKRKLVQTFGEDIIENNAINRVKLGQLVFGNKGKIALLNSIVHPEIKSIILRLEEEHKDEKFVFVDVALLFEAGFDSLVEKVIVVGLDEKTQLERLMNRNNLSKEEAELRIQSQMNSKEKEKLGDYVIDNSKTIENTHTQVEKLLEEITKEEL